MIRKSLGKFTGTATFVLTLLVALVISACNPNSDAVSVLQSENTSLRATIGSYESLIGPTAAAQATLSGQKVAAAQADLATARAQVKELTAQMNSGAVNSGFNSTGTNNIAVQPNNNAVAGNNGAAGGASGVNNAAAADPNAFAFNSLLTAYGKTADGCASRQSTAFSVNDPAIWVIADVRNYKKGTNFAVKWSGGDFTHENDWTVPSDGAQICIHFYIEPTTLNLQPGTYTVTMTATGLPAQQATFTVQGDVMAEPNIASTDAAAGK